MSKMSKILMWIVVILSIVCFEMSQGVPKRLRRRQGYKPNFLLPPNSYDRNNHDQNFQGGSAQETRKLSQAAYGEQELQNLESLNEAPNYDFKYEVHGGGNYLGHSESRRDYKTQGAYHVVLPDGRIQRVTYYADETGYHPTITYEFVGTHNNSIDIQSNPQNDGYRSKRYYKHSKKVDLKTPVKFKNALDS